MMYTIISCTSCTKRLYYTLQNNTVIAYKHKQVQQVQQVRFGFIRTFYVRESGYIETKSAISVSYIFPIWRSKAQKLFPLDHPSASLAQRARSYLHSNCSGCHRPTGISSINLDQLS